MLQLNMYLVFILPYELYPAYQNLLYVCMLHFINSINDVNNFF